MGRDDVVLGKDANMQMHRSKQEPQCSMPFSSAVSEHSRKTPQLSVFSRDPSQKGEVSFKQWAFEVKSVMQSHTVATLREGVCMFLMTSCG